MAIRWLPLFCNVLLLSLAPYQISFSKLPQLPLKLANLLVKLIFLVFGQRFIPAAAFLGGIFDYLFSSTGSPGLDLLRDQGRSPGACCDD